MLRDEVDRLRRNTDAAAVWLAARAGDAAPVVKDAGPPGRRGGRA